MKDIIICLLLVAAVLAHNEIVKMVEKRQMLLCYNAEGGGYLPPLITYKCQLVPRGKGW